MRKTKIISLALSACILTGSISAATDENAVKALSEVSSKYAAEDFIRSYYSQLLFKYVS